MALSFQTKSERPLMHRLRQQRRHDDISETIGCNNTKDPPPTTTAYHRHHHHHHHHHTTTTDSDTATTTATADVTTRIIPAVEGEKEEERKQYRGLATNIPNESIQYMKKKSK
ncbi:uncharacterized protein LOC132938749 [Metopolophium dirhodum]|uniref:uncharacterized protein LOC132938749 n=1 Tax=Metopolophium dirhodum TaxID=44670 RepID=UPI00298F3F5D|nr:uncharacterized protein LOC132938749 [Metopolophium dirhodum]